MSLQNSVNFFYLAASADPSKPLKPGECLNCWDTPGYDLDCGGNVEPCRYCTDSFTGKVPFKQPERTASQVAENYEVAAHWLSKLFGAM